MFGLSIRKSSNIMEAKKMARKAFFTDFESFAGIYVRVVRYIKEDTHRPKKLY